MHSPPLPPPCSPPVHPRLAHVICAGKELLAAWSPLSADRIAIQPGPVIAYAVKEEPAGEAHDSLQDEEARLGRQRAVPAPTKESALASNLRAIARDARGAGRSIGLLPFLVYAVRRRTRVHVVLGTRSVDVVATFAPAMAGICAERQPPCTAIFCRCMVFW